MTILAMAACIGRTGSLSLVRDFFGHPVAPLQKLSLLKQVKRIKHKHIHLNIIRVGVELFDDSDSMTLASAVQRLRDIYAEVPLGIGRVDHFGIPLSEANGYETIDELDDAEDLTEEWTVPGDALDVFVVRVFATEHVGLAPTDGPCGKDSKTLMDGCVFAIGGGWLGTAGAIGHEVGHYLGLGHHDDKLNLMYEVAVGGSALTSEQKQTMLEHCVVRQGC